MDNIPTEALIWMTALASATERARHAPTQHERLAALEAVEEARQRLDEVLTSMHEDVAFGLVYPDHGSRAMVS
jgi:hypothetical protein